MKNIKWFAVGTDGNMKRIAITYDEIDDSGKVIRQNVKVNRVVTDKESLTAIDTIETYIQFIVDTQ